MGIEIKLFATLAQFMPENGEDYPITEGTIVQDVIDQLQLPPDDVTLIFINSVRSSKESLLNDGDRLGLFPPVGGG